MSRLFYFLTVLMTVLTLVAAPNVHSQSLLEEQIPGPLKPWSEWVLLDHQDYSCPFLYNSFKLKRCAWPTRLDLDLNQRQGDFSIIWKVYQESWIQLPGNTKHWPLAVTVNGNPALVLEKKGRPAIKLNAGKYDIKGRFLWDFVPDNLSIPPDSGLIHLTVKEKVIESPSIKQGQLWLRDNDIGIRKPESIENRLDLQVFRRIIDDVPLQVLTRMEIQVSGDQREIKLALPMPDQFIPLRLQSPLPARLEPDGSLLVQVRPGRWNLELLARHDHELDQLSLTINDKNWPESELWVFDARPHLRLVEIENLTPVDPQQTNLPEDWKKYPAYQVRKGETMRFKVLRRGDPSPEPDELNLRRTLWLDFEGSGYTVNDNISGSMTRGWRINALPEMKPGRVTLDGKNQLITRLQSSELDGVEVRKGALNMSADSRITGTVDQISAVGWDQTFRSVKATLHLPPGWRLFAASGVDNVPASWITRWTLLDLFLVLIASLAVSRIWNIWWGMLALVTLALSWHEPGAPRFVWLNILAAVALLKSLPEGRLYTFFKYYRNAAWLGLIIIVVPFFIGQVRMGLYPQLEKPWQPINIARMDDLASAPGKVLSGSAVKMEEQIRKASRLKTAKMPASILSELSYDDSDSGLSVNFDRIDPNANVQTGPGLPQWQWSKINLSWNGTVDHQQQMDFWLVPPKITMLLNFFRVILLTVLALLMFGLLNERIRLKGFPFLMIVMFTVLTIPHQDAYADYPDSELLQELKNRLLEAPDCLPACAQIPEMKLNISKETLEIKLEINAQQSVAVPVPSHKGNWFPDRVTVDGKSAEALYRSKSGQLWVQLTEGRHQLILRGRIPLLNRFSLTFPLKPHRAVIGKSGWTIEGIHEHKIPSSQLQFNRIRTSLQHDELPIPEPGLLPPFLNVERTLQLGLDWRVFTRVVRISPPGSAVVMEIPLLPGESVTTPGIRVKNNRVLINMAPDQRNITWQSVLDKEKKITMTAPETNQWTEIWRADISPVWHVETGGISVIHHQDKQGRWLPEWRPWLGQTVDLLVSRPKGIDGQTLTIDNSRLQLTPGKRSVQAKLEFTLRSSQGAQHPIILPAGIVLQKIEINGKSQPVRLTGKKVILPVKPGRQTVRLSWLDQSKLTHYFKTPLVNMGINTVNSNISIGLGQDRWVLFTSGPVFGPAVLFWSVLIVIAILSVGLGFISLTPLRHWQWFLLLIGLSQIPLPAVILIVAWLMILGLRGRNSLTSEKYFNAAQVGIGFLTIISLVLLFVAIKQGLLGSPDMQIIGNQSSAYHLNWYQDRTGEELPAATVISVPLMSYRVLMLIWSLWLAVSLLNWLKWGWDNFSDGGIWKKSEPVTKKL